MHSARMNTEKGEIEIIFNSPFPHIKIRSLTIQLNPDADLRNSPPLPSAASHLQTPAETVFT